MPNVTSTARLSQNIGALRPHRGGAAGESGARTNAAYGSKNAWKSAPALSTKTDVKRRSESSRRAYAATAGGGAARGHLARGAATGGCASVAAGVDELGASPSPRAMPAPP